MMTDPWARSTSFVLGAVVVAWGIVMVTAPFSEGIEPPTSTYRPVWLGLVWLSLGGIAIVGAMRRWRSSRALTAAGLALLVAGLTATTVLPKGSYFRMPPAWPRGSKPTVPPGYLWLAATALVLVLVGALIFAYARGPRRRTQRRRPGTWILLAITLSLAGFALWTGWHYSWLAPPIGTGPGELLTSSQSNLDFHRFVVFLATCLALPTGISLGRRAAARESGRREGSEEGTVGRGA